MQTRYKVHMLYFYSLVYDHKLVTQKNRFATQATHSAIDNYITNLNLAEHVQSHSGNKFQTTRFSLSQ
jgi:hypothetical protein